MAQQERRLVEGLAMIVPQETATLTRQRMAHLHPTAVKWELYEFDQRHDAAQRLGYRRLWQPGDSAGAGNG